MKFLKHLFRHYSFENPASVYDEEAMTALELAARTAKKVNECVDVINEHMVDCDQKHNDQDKVIEGAKKYMVDHIGDSVKDLFDQAVADGVIDSVTQAAYENLTNDISNMTAGVFNVRDFGATGDGVNDREAIQAAIDAAKQVEGSTVYLPAGEYHIDETLIIYSHTRLIGAGKRGLSDKGFSGTHIVGSCDPIIRTDPNATAIYGAELRDLRVSCDGEEHSSTAIYFDNASECYMHNVSVNGNADIGVRFEGTISHLDGLYLAGNRVGLQLLNAHGVTVSNLNAWMNDQYAIEISGNCCAIDIRDSWIENSARGVAFTQSEGLLVCYNTTVQNVSFTVGAEYDESKMIWVNDITETNPYLVQGLRVADCVAKISNGGSAVLIKTSRYTTTATVENCRFLTGSSYEYAIHHTGRFDAITLVNNACADYDGNTYPIINSEGGNHFSMNTNSRFTEFVSDRPIRLPIATDVQTLDEGQLYYKEGHLRMTNGEKACIIPNCSGWAVSTPIMGCDINQLTTSVQDLIFALKESGIIL